MQENSVIWYKKILFQVLPRYLIAMLKYEIRLTLLKISSLTKKGEYRAKRGLYVNIGAGDSGKCGWVNVDAVKNKHINLIYDVRKHLPFQSGSVKAIFTEHFFEHLDYIEEAPYFLRECIRVLEKGGVLRIIVPDAEKYIKAYNIGGWDEYKKIRPLDDSLRDCFGVIYKTRMELINIVFRQWGQHKYAYDYETLEILAKRCGFEEVKRQQYGQSVLPELCLDKPRRASESLYVEAIKTF